MSRRKLTPQEKELFESMLSYSTRADRWRIFWWGIVSRRKQWALMDRLWDGMNWYSAMKQVKENPPPKGTWEHIKEENIRPHHAKYTDDKELLTPQG